MNMQMKKIYFASLKTSGEKLAAQFGLLQLRRNGHFKGIDFAPTLQRVNVIKTARQKWCNVSDILKHRIDVKTTIYNST